MSKPLTNRIRTAIENREKNGLLRQLRCPNQGICDFSSNDYLGLTRLVEYENFVKEFLQQYKPHFLSFGSTGSRLLTGHNDLISHLEKTASTFHCMNEALLFNSGYDANLSILSTIPGPNDVIIYDELVHASMHDGMRMSRAKSRLYPFNHNDIVSLEDVIRKSFSQHSHENVLMGSIIVCVETVYSMDGDIAPLKYILDICEALQIELSCEIHLIVDEAHGGGIYGQKGQGVVIETEMNNHSNLLAIVVTFGKAFGAHGAMMLCQMSELRKYLINYARPLIYSTALSPHSICVLQATYQFMETDLALKERKKLMNIIRTFQVLTSEELPPQMLLYNSKDEKMRRRYATPIQAVVVKGNELCVEMTNLLRKEGFDVYPIRSPTVPKGLERIRIVLHAHNTEKEIKDLIQSIKILSTYLKPRARM